MKDSGALKETLDLYNKHGWTLRRVLISDGTRSNLRNSEGEIFGNVLPEPADIDAAWFSRPSHAGGEAWELRSLAETPFAVVEVIPIDAPDDERKEVLERLELRIKEMQARRGGS